MWGILTNGQNFVGLVIFYLIINEAFDRYLSNLT